MKLKTLLFASASMVGATLVPATSFADCSPACSGGDVCRYDSTRSPQFYCAAPKTKSVAGPRAPVGAGSAGAVQKAAPTSGATARTAGPGPKPASQYSFGANQTAQTVNAKSNGAPKRSIQSPRDVASGQATGRRQHKP